MTTDTLVGVLRGGAINGQSFAARAGNLSRPERASYRRILQHFIEGSPSPLDSTPAQEVARLIEADLIQTDHDCLTAAYPFSGQPTRHRVIMHDGRGYHAMCAIDALGIPYMLDERGEVRAREPDGRGIVRVTVDPKGELTWAPEQAVALAAFGDGCCLAESACPHINLFASPDAATRYLDTDELQGSVLSIPDATAAGRWVFGDLLDSLADGEGAS
jgi:alkylmercury lyase